MPFDRLTHCSDQVTELCACFDLQCNQTETGAHVLRISQEYRIKTFCSCQWFAVADIH